MVVDDEVDSYKICWGCQILLQKAINQGIQDHEWTWNDLKSSINKWRRKHG